MKKINEKMQEYKYNIERQKFMSRWISNIGDIKEEEERIICYVSKALLKGLTITCYGMPTNEKCKQSVEYYKLEKPVYYIFDGIEFNNVSFTSVFNNVLVFRNCTFNSRVNFVDVNKVVLENNTYVSMEKDEYRPGSFLNGDIEELVIQNDNIKNHFKCLGIETDFGVNIKAKRLTILDSTISAENEGQIYIKAQEANFMDSTLEASEMYLDLDTITYAESLLKSSQGIIIENKNCNCDVEMGFYHVDAPYVVYNGIEMINEEKKNQEQNQSCLQEARIPLVQVFTNLQNKCNQNIVMQYLKKENDQPISRVLKK